MDFRPKVGSTTLAGVEVEVEDRAPRRMGRNEFIGFLATISATTALGIDIILPAFGDARDSFGLPGDSTRIALTVTVYFLGLSLAQLAYGPLTDRFGRKPVLVAGLALYVGGALASSLAPGLGVLLAARLVWGIGAAGPRVLMVAIARDTFEGDRLGQVMSMAMAIFMVVPAVAPLIGQGVVALGGWRLAFAAPMIPSLALIAWTIVRLDETLPAEERRPLTFAKTADAVRAVVGNRATLGFTLAVMFDFASFASFLSSTELLFDRVYDRSSQFPLAFALMSAVMGAVTLTGANSVGRFGATSIISVFSRCNVLVAGGLLAVSLAGAGSPNFWLWFGLITIGNSMRTLVNPLVQSEAMQPMGDLAGTAAAVIGTISMGGGALLAGITDRFINDSVTPLSLSYLGYGILTATAIHLSVRRSQSANQVPSPPTSNRSTNT